MSAVSRQDKLPTGILLVVPSKDGAEYFWEAKFRVHGRQVKRRLGKAWVEPRPEPLEAADGWLKRFRKRRGKPAPGYLSPDQATIAKGEAIAAAAANLSRTADGHDVLFEEAAGRWFEDARRIRGWKQSTTTTHAAALTMPDRAPKMRGRPPKARLMRAFAGRSVASITAGEVRDFLRDLDVDDEIGPRTVNHLRQLLLEIFAYAAEHGWVNGNPAAATEKRRENDLREIITYTPQQVRNVAAYAPDDLTRSLIEFAAFTGLRQGELLELRWRDISLESGVIHVQRSYSASTVSSTKSRASRAVPISDQARQALDRLPALSAPPKPSDLVFTATGDHLDPSTIRRKYFKARDAACAEDSGLSSDLTFHDLRHCFGSMCAEGGMDIVRIQHIMGHSSIRTTQRYLHFRPSSNDAAQLSEAIENVRAR